MGRDDALGPSALGAAGVGIALSHHAVPACRAAGPATAQEQCGLGAADDAAGVPLAAGAAAGVGRRWRLCGGLPGPSMCQNPGGHGVAPALSCRAVSSARASW